MKYSKLRQTKVGERRKYMNSLTIIKPDDWHVHFREGNLLKWVVPYTARQFSRAIVMPNLEVPITSIKQANDYRNQILEAAVGYPSFQPLMTAYLNKDLHSDDLRSGFIDGVFAAAKLYPANVTTNSAHGVKDIKDIYHLLEIMQEIKMPLLVHGEVIENHIDIFDRETVFIDKILEPLRKQMPELRIVFEHITTKNAVDYLKSEDSNIAATITAHHLHINRNDMLSGGIKPHLYCLPIAKREIHRLELVKAATSGNKKFFLGSDSAPHFIGDKESACGCAGIFSAPQAIEHYLEVFDKENAIENFEKFASLNGPDFYGLPHNKEKITIEKKSQKIETLIGKEEGKIHPFRSATSIDWTFKID